MFISTTHIFIILAPLHYYHYHHHSSPPPSSFINIFRIIIITIMVYNYNVSPDHHFHLNLTFMIILMIICIISDFTIICLSSLSSSALSSSSNHPIPPPPPPNFHSSPSYHKQPGRGPEWGWLYPPPRPWSVCPPVFPATPRASSSSSITSPSSPLINTQAQNTSCTPPPPPPPFRQNFHFSPSYHKQPGRGPEWGWLCPPPHPWSACPPVFPATPRARSACLRSASWLVSGD